ncbi:hypothetical protein D6C78_07611, partial [Aureobasidium pullulans]
GAYTSNQAKREGRLQAIELDGHKSHIKEGSEELAKKHKIRLHVLSPHTSGLLQPLHLALALFPPQNQLYDLQQFQDASPIERKDFSEIYYKARCDTLTSRDITECWRQAGIVPWNVQHVVDKEEVKKYTSPEATPTRDKVTTPRHPRDTIRYMRDTPQVISLNVMEKYEQLKEVCRKTNHAFGRSTITILQKENEVHNKNRELTEALQEKPRIRSKKQKGKGLLSHAKVV